MNPSVVKRHGVLLACGAYAIWGLFPLYFHALAKFDSLTIAAHRTIWSLVFVGIGVAFMGTASKIRQALRGRRTLLLLMLGAVVNTSNWLIYIWAVNSGQVIEASLGYFIGPITTVFVGVMVLRESLRPAQWTAVGIGVVAVLALTLNHGRPPFIALSLAATWAIYGLVKKQAGVPAFEGLFIEMATMALPMLAYLIFWPSSAGFSAMVDPLTGVLLAGSGIVGLAPMVLFAAAVNRAPLSMVGLLQYLEPCLQFALGLLYFGESMPAVRWLGFLLIWLALTVFVTDVLKSRRHSLGAAAFPVIDALFTGKVTHPRIGRGYG